MLLAYGASARPGWPIFWDAATIIDAPGEVEIGAGFRSYNTPVPSRIEVRSLIFR